MEWQISEFDRQAGQVWPAGIERPPTSVVAALLAVTRGQNIKHSYADKYSTTGTGVIVSGREIESTTWQIIALTDDRIAYVEAYKGEADWTQGSPSAKTEPPDSLVAWSRPLSTVSAVDVTSSSLKRLDRDAVEVAFTWRVRVEGEDAIGLPQGGADRRYAPDVEAIVRAIDAAIGN